MKKKGYEFSFSWFFALIVGASIIFLAIYAATQFSTVLRTGQDAETAQQIGILLTPLETNLEQAKFATITTPRATQIFNECDASGVFGTQKISAALKSGLGDEWLPDPGVKSSFRNKYLFSSSREGGDNGAEQFYVLSKPFSLPFKIADLIIMWDEHTHYCFIDPFPEIVRDIKELNMTNVFVENCPDSSVNVCFARTGCDIDIDRNARSVRKEGKTIYYTESLGTENNYALVYAAIFSDPETYNCQVQRLMGRASELGILYNEKSIYLTARGCTSPRLQSDLNQFIAKTQEATEETSQESLRTHLNEITEIAQSLRRKNAAITQCRLF